MALHPGRGYATIRAMANPLAATLLSALLVCASATAAGVTQAPHVDDPSGIASDGSGWAAGVERRLGSIEASSGIRIVLQFHAKSPTPQEDSVAGAYMKGIATSLGVAQKGVLMVYFADDPDWRIWVGDDLTSRFAGKPGTAAELTASGAMHEAKEAYLTGSVAKADARFQSDKAARPTSAKIAAEADTLLDNLCLKLGLK